MIGVLLAVALRASPAAAPAAPVPVHVQADEVRYNDKRRETVFVGRPLVTLTRADATLQCKRLVAHNDDKGQVRHALCEGDVKLVRGERTATCATATFDNESGRVVCEGNPVLREGESVLHGEKLTYDLNEDRVEMSRVSGTVVPRQGETEQLAPKKREEKK